MLKKSQMHTGTNDTYKSVAPQRIKKIIKCENSLIIQWPWSNADCEENNIWIHRKPNATSMKALFDMTGSKSVAYNWKTL